jgi:hypothetical protein
MQAILYHSSTQMAKKYIKSISSNLIDLTALSKIAHTSIERKDYGIGINRKNEDQYNYILHIVAVYALKLPFDFY